MKIVSTIEEVRAQVKEWKKEGQSIGFVPTMGYLHEGHMSLIDAAGENDKVVVSIFVNPMQFGPTEDLASYPRDLEHDAKLCEEHGVDLIFHPTPEEMYGDQFYSYVDMDVLTKELCGLSRPVHFRGVCTVVTKLFNIVTPDRAYFGQKDAQQLAVIKRMVKDLLMYRFLYDLEAWEHTGNADEENLSCHAKVWCAWQETELEEKEENTKEQERGQGYESCGYALRYHCGNL